MVLSLLFPRATSAIFLAARDRPTLWCPLWFSSLTLNTRSVSVTSVLRLVVGTEGAKAPPGSGKIFATREEDTSKCYGSPLDKGFPPDRVLFLLVGRVGNVDGMPTLSLPPNHSYFIALLHSPTSSAEESFSSAWRCLCSGSPGFSPDSCSGLGSWLPFRSTPTVC